MSSGGCKSSVNRLDVPVHIGELGRGWQPGNEVWNVMYDCIKAQVKKRTGIREESVLYGLKSGQDLYTPAVGSWRACCHLCIAAL